MNVTNCLLTRPNYNSYNNSCNNVEMYDNASSLSFLKILYMIDHCAIYYQQMYSPEIVDVVKESENCHSSTFKVISVLKK